MGDVHGEREERPVWLEQAMVTSISREFGEDLTERTTSSPPLAPMRQRA